MSEWQPSVSVVLAAYNAAATIEACIRSLLELRYPADLLELRVVDNGSRDGTIETLHRFSDRIVLTEELRRGPGAARNAGVWATGAEVVAFTDADCVVDRDWLVRLVEALEDPRVGIAGGTILALAPAGDVERFGERIHDHRAAIEVFRPPYAMTASWASRRSLLCAVGGFDEQFRRTQDVDLSYRIVQAGYSLVFVPGAVVYHRNEQTLVGLFSEGFVHGFHGVRTRKRHARFLQHFGHGNINARAYRDLARGLLRWARGVDHVHSRCETVFNAGKKAGKVVGSVRFGHLDL